MNPKTSTGPLAIAGLPRAGAAHDGADLRLVVASLGPLVAPRRGGAKNAAPPLTARDGHTTVAVSTAQRATAPAVGPRGANAAAFPAASSLPPFAPDGSPAGGSKWSVARAPQVTLPPPQQLAAESALDAEVYFRSQSQRIKLLQSGMHARGGVNPLSHWPNASPPGGAAAVASAMQTALASTGGAVKSYSFGRAPLAIELETFLQRELFALRQHHPPPQAVGSVDASGALVNARRNGGKVSAPNVVAPTTLQQAPVFREILSCLSNHFGEYQGLFAQLVSYYDVLAGELRQVYRSLHALQTEHDSTRDRFHGIVRDVREQGERELARSQDELAKERRDHAACRDREEALHKEVSRLSLSHGRVKADYEDANARAHLFEANLRDLSEKGVELVKLKHKLVKENETLKHMVAALEQRLRAAEIDVLVEQSSKTRFSKGGPQPPGWKRSVNGGSRRTRPPSIMLIETPSATSLVAAGDAAAVTANPSTRDAAPQPPPDGMPLLVVDPSHATATANTSSASLLDGEPSGSIESQHVPGAAQESGAPDMNEDAAGESYDVATMPLDVEELHDHVIELEQKLKRSTRANLILQRDNKTLVERIEGLLANIERDQQDMTPRPRWELVVTSLPQFPMSELSTSREILEELLVWLKDQDDQQKRDVEVKALSQTVRQWLGEENACESDLQGRRHRFFVCKGTGEHVPVFLRARGTVRNRKLAKGDTEKLLARFWTARRMHLRAQTTLHAQALGDFLLAFLTQYTGSDRGAIELAYNVVASCERNNHDPDCSMFLRIIRRELSELAMFDQHDMLTQLKDAIAEQDRQQKLKVSRFAIHRVLTTMFPAKSKRDMMRLRFALIVSARGASVVDYVSLFTEDDEGNQSRFVTLLREQHVEEVTTFAVEVEEALRDVIRDHSIDINEARIAVKRLDAEMPNEKIEEIMAFGCAMTVDDLGDSGQYFKVPAEPFLSRIRSGCLLKRYGRKPADDGDDDDHDLDNDAELDIAAIDEVEKEKSANPSDEDLALLHLSGAKEGTASFTAAMENLFRAQKEAMEKQRRQLRRKRLEKTLQRLSDAAPVQGQTTPLTPPENVAPSTT